MIRPTRTREATRLFSSFREVQLTHSERLAALCADDAVAPPDLRVITMQVERAEDKVYRLIQSRCATTRRDLKLVYGLADESL